MPQKSSPEEIRQRFDKDVERFSNLQTGQSATIDAPLVLDLIAHNASQVSPNAQTILDVGCGAGNYTLKLLERLPGRNAILVDLSRPMLDRAVERISAVTEGLVVPIQGDIRDIELNIESVDIVLAAAVLHHLRTPEQWLAVFKKFHAALTPGGSLWVSDLVAHEIPAVHDTMWTRYGAYLSDFRDEGYRDQVFDYIEKEDSPTPVTQQLRWVEEAGFSQVDLLHKNGPFAAYCAFKAG